MAYSIFLGTSKNRYEIYALELEENLHNYIFEKHMELISKDSRFYRMSNYYKDAVFFYEDTEVFVSELDKLIQESNDSKFIDILVSIKKVCVTAIINKKTCIVFVINPRSKRSVHKQSVIHLFEFKHFGV